VTRYFFPDNTVLIYFTMMGRQDLLLELLDGRGCWTITIEGECRASSTVEGLSGMTVFLDELSDSLIPSPAERTDASLFRSRLAQAGDSERDHLGESETLAVVSARSIPAICLTDDIRAAALAQSLGIATATTLDVLRIAVRAGKLSPDGVLALGEILVSRGRRLAGMPRSGADLHLWLA
jgi:hypothetical protein